MSNLYRMTKAADEVAGWFDAIIAAGGANLGAEVFLGYPGLVIAGGVKDDGPVDPAGAMGN